MGGLVQVHEVHVDLVVGDLLVVLGRQMAVGLLEIGKPVDPHFAGREGVAPGDDSGALVPVIGLFDHVGDLLVGLGRDFIHQRVRKNLTQLRRHLFGAGVHGVQHVLPVQKLTADDEPKFTFHDVLHSRFLTIGFIWGLEDFYLVN